MRSSNACAARTFMHGIAANHPSAEMKPAGHFCGPHVYSFLNALRSLCGLLRLLRSESRAHLRREEQRLFPRREVPALVHLVEVGELRIAALRPASGGLVDLAGEDGDRRRDGEVFGAEVRGLDVPLAAR